MRRTITLAPLLFFALVRLPAQTIPMIELTADDSAQVKAAQQKLEQTQNDWQDLQQAMYVKYGMPTNAFFSYDFHFLVGSGDPAPLKELAKDDTAKLTAVCDQLVQARTDADSLRRHIFALYVRDAVRKPGEDPFANSNAPLPKYQGFRYTADYRFVLPN